MKSNVRSCDYTMQLKHECSFSIVAAKNVAVFLEDVKFTVASISEC
jgi:hypothetical protein